MASPSDLRPTDVRRETMPDSGGSIAVEDVNMDWDTGLDADPPLDFWSFGTWNTTDSEASSLSNMELSSIVQSANGRYHDFTGPIGLGDDHELGDRNVGSSHEGPLSPIAAARSGSESAWVALPTNNYRKRDWTGHSLDDRTYVTARSQEPSKCQVLRPSISDRPTVHRVELSTTSPPVSAGVLDPPNKSWRTSLSASNISLKASRPNSLSASRPSTRPTAVQPSGLFGVDEINSIICEYPKHMLRSNFWSPFVHHRHHRCSQGGLAEPIAVALCCVSARLQSVESSVPFLCRMINDERENLIRDFPNKMKNLEDAIAMLHAMCIYQIETVLAIRMQKAVQVRISSTGTYHHFLLKMTRRLCQQHNERVSLKENTAISWHSWTMAETLRRTTFLVDMCNELSYHTNALNGVYYESLDDGLLLDMPLPAPDSMWRASSEDEWATARDATGWTGAGVVTLRSAMDGQDTIPRSLDENPGSDSMRSDKIQQISKLIISSARHLKGRQLQ